MGKQLGCSDHADVCEYEPGEWEFQYEAAPGAENGGIRGYYWLECPECQNTIVADEDFGAPTNDEYNYKEMELENE